MLFLRYLFSIVFSFLIHSLAFSSAPPPSLYLELNATQQSSIAIQLVAPVKVADKVNKPIKEQQTLAQKMQTKARHVVKKTKPEAVQEKLNMAKNKPVITPLKQEPNTVKEVTEINNKNENMTKKEQQKDPQEIEKSKQSVSTAKQSAPKIVEKITFRARPAPIAYPHSAKRRNIDGVVLIEVWLDEQGKQTKQRIINSSGHQILDKAALKGISKWQFSPQQDDGLAIAYRVQVPINFGLN